MRCLHYTTPLCDCMTGETKTVEQWFKSQSEFSMLSYDVFSGEAFADTCLEIHYTGIQEVFEIEFDNGQKELVTLDHKFLCDDGSFHTVQEIINNGINVMELTYE